jgi:hypothetical protein
VRNGRVEVFKIPRESNPADLMTTILRVQDIKVRLGKMGLIGVFQGDGVEVSQVCSVEVLGA